MSETAGAIKYDQGKVQMELVSPIALYQLAAVLTFGAKKYESWNWSKGLKLMRCFGAALRHMFSWMRGETLDPESGLPHLAHAMCNLMFMLHLSETMPSMDDRPVQAMTLELPKRKPGEKFIDDHTGVIIQACDGPECTLCLDYYAGKHTKVL